MKLFKGTPISFTFHTPQTQSTMQQRSAHTSAQYSTNATQHNGVIQQGAPASMHQMLDLYYTSLCQPAFPEPGTYLLLECISEHRFTSPFPQFFFQQSVVVVFGFHFQFLYESKLERNFNRGALNAKKVSQVLFRVYPSRGITL